LTASLITSQRILRACDVENLLFFGHGARVTLGAHLRFF
jgi:hypothetical protein